MNNTIKKALKLVLWAGVAVVLTVYGKYSADGAKQGLEICINSVVPSLLPFMATATYLLKSDILTKQGGFGERLSRILFRLPKESLLIYFLSLIGGYPIGAKLIGDGVNQGILSKNQGKRMMLFCINPGPAFVINIVGVFMLNSKKAGIILLFGVTLSSFFMGLASAVLEKNDRCIKVKKADFTQTPLLDAVNDSIKGILSICIWIILFGAFSGIVNALDFSQNVKLWFNMLGEVTAGCSVSVKSFPLSVTAFVLGFSGICIHFQVMQYVKQTGLRYKHFFVSRILNGVLSLGITAFLFKVFPCRVEVFSNVSQIVPKAVSVSLPSTVALIFLFVLVILDLAPKEKV